MSRTSTNADNDRFDAFADAVSANLLPVTLSMDDVRAFSGAVRSTTVGTVHLGRVLVANDIAVKRTAKLIDRGGADYLKIGMQLSGSCLVSQGDRKALLEPGHYVVYDTAHPYELMTRGPFQMQTAMFPRSLLRLPAAQLSQLTARPISGRSGLGLMASSFAVELGRRSADEFGSATTYLADAALDLFAASLVEQLPASTAQNQQADRKILLLRVRAFIDSHLDDGDLDVPTIAAAHHVSVRHLQKVFEQEGQTVSGWIRDRRIDRCRRDLASVALAQTPVSSIAANWGLVNASHFTRLFRARFGETPRDYRRRALHGASADPSRRETGTDGQCAQ